MLADCDNSQPPTRPQDLCSVFKEKPGWYRQAKKSEARWGTSVPVMMAIMYQESCFRQDVRPPRRWFWIIPLPRKSSAYGYAQAQDAVWGEYLKEAGGWFSSRKNFGDAIDFIGWYNHKSHRINKVSLQQADQLYLNYHEGWRGFRKQHWKSKKWLQKTAKKIQSQAAKYQVQLGKCHL